MGLEAPKKIFAERAAISAPGKPAISAATKVPVISSHIGSPKAWAIRRPDILSTIPTTTAISFLIDSFNKITPW